MSQGHIEASKNIELVRRAFYPPGDPDLVPRFADREALAARLEAYLHPDFEAMNDEPTTLDMRAAGKGARPFVDMYANWLSTWESFHVTPIELHDLDDRVLSVVRMRGRTRTHGAEVEQESAVIFGIEDDLIRTMKLFTRAHEARREAGLER